MRAACFGPCARQAFAAKGLNAHDGADHIAVDVDIADASAGGELLRTGVDARLDAERQAVAQGIDLIHHALRVALAVLPVAQDVQHRCENLLLQIADLRDLHDAR